MSLAVAFRQNMRAQRVARGLSQEALAVTAGYCESYISRVERGSKPNPSLAFVETIAGALGCAPAELLGAR